MACGSTGWLLDLVHVPLFGGEPGLELRSAPVLLAAMAWGPWAGAMAAMLAGAGMALGGQAWLCGLTVAQAAVVGALPRWRIPALVAMFLFWLGIEAPALLLAGGGGPTRGALTAASLLASGGLGVSLAELALARGAVRRLLSPSPPFAGRRPLRSTLVHTFVVLGALPSLLAADLALHGAGPAAAEPRRLETLAFWVPLMGLSLWILSRTAASVTRPLAQLARAQADLAAHTGEPVLADPSPSGPVEIERLVDGFRRVASALTETARERERLNAELERKVLERTAELAAATAEAQAHSQAKGRFLAHMSHEIRTPLNGVVGITDLLSGTELSAAQRKQVAALRANAAALLAVVNDILDMSKIESGSLGIDARPEVLGELVEAMGGTIACVSRPGQGTTFTLSLHSEPAPLAADAGPCGEIEARPAPRRSGVPRILLVDDNPTNLGVTGAHLARRGLAVDFARDGTEALAHLAGGGYDLVFLDCRMPGLDGRAVARAHRQNEAAQPGRRLPIVALTADAVAGDREQCLAAGMDDYLTKPLAGEDLDRALARWLPTGAGGDAPTLDPKVIASLDDPDDPGFLVELVDLFLADAPPRLELLSQAAAERSWEAAVEAAHALQGSAANMGARSLSQICRRALALARSQDGEIVQATAQAERELARTAAALRSLVADRR